MHARGISGILHQFAFRRSIALPRVIQGDQFGSRTKDVGRCGIIAAAIAQKNDRDIRILSVILPRSR